MECSHIFKSRKLIIIAFFAFSAVFSNLSTQVYAQVDTINVASEPEASAETVEHESEKFDITSFIFHHIGDANEFTFWGHDDSWTGLYLPMILWTDNGLTIFSAKKFQLDNEASVIAESNGNRFVRYHNKVYYASEEAHDGHYLEKTKDAEGNYEILNAKPLNFSITKNVFTILLSSLILILVFTSVAGAYKKRRGKAPKGFQSLVEPIILFVRDDIAKPNLGHKYERYMPYLLTVFFFIWFNNMFGLVPFFPGGANVTGNIAVTMVLAVFTFVITSFSGNKYYWGHVFRPNVPWWLYPLMVPVEIFGLFTKPFALMIRLFANITAGHILVLSLLGLIFIFNSMVVAPVSILFAVFIMMIELLVAFIQAFIFTILSALFIGLAIEEHH